MSEEITIADNPGASRFEIMVDGEIAGFADYRLRGEKIVFTHTEIDSAYEGRGLGSRLAAAALDASRDTGLVVVPTCPFIARYIDRHPEYKPLLSPDQS